MAWLLVGAHGALKLSDAIAHLRQAVKAAGNHSTSEGMAGKAGGRMYRWRDWQVGQHTGRPRAGHVGRRLGRCADWNRQINWGRQQDGRAGG